MRRAFARNGIEAGKDVVSDDVVTISGDGYYYRGCRYETVETLLNEVLDPVGDILL